MDPPRKRQKRNPSKDLEKPETTAVCGRPKPRLKKTATPPQEKAPQKVWPQHFKELQRVFKALNLVYTFCCARKHFATTYSNIKSTVEGHIKKELTVEDIAQIKTILPTCVHFAYVDEAMLQVYVAAASQPTGSKRQKEVEDVYAMAKRDQDDAATEVLYFEFTDGNLKPKFEATRIEDIKMPTYSPAQMTKIIQKRNEKFDDAVNRFIDDCEKTALDPVIALQSKYRPNVPKQTTLEVTEIGLSLVKPAVPKERGTIEEIVNEIKASNIYCGQIVPNGHIITPPQEAQYGDLAFQLSQSLVNALYNARGIDKFYLHQARAMNSLYEGKNVIVSTSTSSGKSLIYQVPVLHRLESDPQTRAMYIFPTKALAQDQKRSLCEVLEYMRDALGDILVETFDGDTPQDQRRRIREEASIIFTNPGMYLRIQYLFPLLTSLDMIHIAILPHQEKWRVFLRNLKLVVVDELHYYNGLFGSHVSFIMRRLRRICASVGNDTVQFVSCSATIADPSRHMRTIFGLEDVESIVEDGSPSGLKEFLCWNSPFRDPNDPTSGRVEVVNEGARLLAQLVLRGVRTIAFCKVRKACEMLLTAVRQELEHLGQKDVAGMIMAYRGGYTPQDRRKIEREMFEGRLLGIVATNALELGVDIGSLDAVIIVGFPFTIANLRQQSGRAGRRNKDSLSILVGDSFASDQHYMTHPDEIFSKPNEELQVDLENNLVLEGHLQCAAFEQPINIEEDEMFFGALSREIIERRLVKDNRGLYHCHERFRPQPSQFVKIRDTEDGHIVVVDVTNGRNAVLEEVEPSRAIFTLYEEGIFLHQGYSYLVRSFNPDKKIATVSLVKVDWTTSPRDFTDIDPIETELIQHINGSPFKAYFGKIRITAVVFGYFKMDKQKRILDACETDSNPLVMMAKGLWIDVPPCALKMLTNRKINLAASIHAAQHALLSMIPNFVVSALGEVRTECKAPQKEFMKRETSRKRPARLTVYDSKGGPQGSGICMRVLSHVERLLRMAVERVEACRCEVGCPECKNQLSIEE